MLKFEKKEKGFYSAETENYKFYVVHLRGYWRLTVCDKRFKHAGGVDYRLLTLKAAVHLAEGFESLRVSEKAMATRDALAGCHEACPGCGMTFDPCEKAE